MVERIRTGAIVAVVCWLVVGDDGKPMMNYDV